MEVSLIAVTVRQRHETSSLEEDLEELVSAVEELPFLSRSSQQYDARQLSMAAWSLGKLKPHLPAAAVTSACTAIDSHSASSEAMEEGSWREWSNLLHGLATAGMQCSSSPDMTWLCEQAVQLLPGKLTRGAADQAISMTLWAMAKSGYTGSAQPLLQSVTAAISQGLRQYDPAPRPKQDLEQLVSAVEELPFLSSRSSQVEQTSQLLWCFADWARQPENSRARMTLAQCNAMMALLQHMAGDETAGDAPAFSPLQQFDARQLSMAAWSLGKLKPHLPAAPVTSASTALASHSASTAVSQGEFMGDAKPQAWANLIWAASKLPGCREEARQLLNLFASRAQAVVPGLGAQGVSNILYAM
ncbi:hypothetical protein HaLaN_03730 [Haematococcus lacustris]|uniref:RAP domain-containing protein n=1 Tax=Haematococcus lacustris TaxID=44745 RepID=A0A699YL90_HAELA|nr:hypothetical protein HaLaN_03730 [Haematococcus lacustris]